ncbi:MAG: hypothetical protein V4651_00915 [Bacteroidota bacterium]
MSTSCGIVRETPKTEFKDGYYIQKAYGKKQLVYIDLRGDDFRMFPAQKINRQKMVDSVALFKIYPKEVSIMNHESILFQKNSLDIDFLITPLKFRAATGGVPAQLNATLNGSVYLGYRTDKYFVRYNQNALNVSTRILDHYGASFGFFGGLGNASLTPTTTSGFISSEYDGVVFSKGVAGIIAVNNFTVGLAVGFDQLLDNNKKYWLYESKPWFGLTFGLNLN